MESTALAVFGTLGGAIVGALAALATESRRQRHEDQSRWHAERFQHYANVLRASDQYMTAMENFARQVQALTHLKVDPLDFERWPDTPNRHMLDQACREAELVASWRGLTYPSLKLLRSVGGDAPSPDGILDPPIGDKAQWDDWLGRFRAALNTFEDAAKTELGIYRRGERKAAALPIYLRRREVQEERSDDA